MAAWLHDVGYAESAAVTGFHPLDGAKWLRQQGAPEGIVALVAYHSGARFEAEERGLADELAFFPAPDQSELDVLTLIDMSTSSIGERVAVNERLAEILVRYPEEHAVHRAVSRSRGYLADSADRAAKRLGLAGVRTGSVL
jgi:hypothetical protein